MLPLVIAMAVPLFAIIGYALLSPDPVTREWTDEEAGT
jgi:hypothetical protein